MGLDELGLVAAVEHCLDQWRARLPDTRIALTVLGAFDDVREELSVTVYRVIQEAMTNIGKHADAQRASITLERCPHRRQFA